MQKRLDGYQKAVETQILVDLRRCLDGISLKTDRGFQELKDEVQKLIISVSQGANSFDTVVKAIQSEHRQTRELIVANSRQYQQLQDETENRKRLLQSLWFDELYNRVENIKEAHRKTFEWIFERPEQSTGPWDNFVEWLEKGDHIYWIHGKAGSGKSTLMKFLCQDDRISESLATWSANERVLLPSFYFWSGGNRMEKSVEGLLRSLIWQILNALPELHIGLSQDDLHSSGFSPVWTERRLRNRLQDTIQHLPKTHSICFFIDGLDEFDGEQASLISLVKHIAQNTKVKICLSSRPLQVFKRAFETASKLCLQDMTPEDLRAFVQDKLIEISQVSPVIAQQLTDKITERAAGVFLWVSLAVRDQLRGFKNGDSPGLLMKRLKSWPDEIEKVYERMLNQIERFYRHEAAIFLQIALHGEDSSLLSHTLASHSGLDDMLGSDERIPELDLVELSLKIQSRIIITCGGLLESIEDQEDMEVNTTDDEEPTDDEERTDDEDNTDHEENADEEEQVLDFDERRHIITNEANSGDSDEASSSDERSLYEYPGETANLQIERLARKIHVHFVHRSAVDFMRDPNKGGAFLEANTPDSFHPQVFYVKVLLADMRLFGLLDRYGAIDDVMYSMSLAEHETKLAQTTLCNLLENIMSRIDQKYGGSHDDSHWSERWGDSYKGWKLAKEEHHERQKSRPQPGLGTSRESIRCQRDTIDTSSLILGMKWNFLLFAASHGILRYVRHTLENDPTVSTRDAVIYLLHLSIFSVRLKYGSMYGMARVLSGLRLAQELLSGDVDLNPEVSSDSTVWSMFLVRMSSILLSSFWETRRIYSEIEVLEQQTEFAKIMIAFIASGAVLTQTIVITLSESSYKDSKKYYYRFGLSVCAIAELCLKGQSELCRIREACIDARAPYYAECFSVQVTRGLSGTLF